ncbi:MAG: dehydratase [Chloroflexi bacterium]|nr:MAG: dehydratase [Chloroflexota bacterium]RLC86990.1 MAG: dehydratase [Chloroflexota bacterium]
MTDLNRPRGRYFEEFEIGDTVETAARTITETDVVLFAGLSGDYNPLHTDAEFAKGTLFGERVAHGLLGLSIASGLASRLGFVEGTAQAFTALEWKFRGPIRIGDTIRVQARVRQKKEMPRLGGGFVVFDVAILNQRGETVQKGTWTVLIKSAP